MTQTKLLWGRRITKQLANIKIWKGMFNCKHTKPDGVTGQQAAELQIKIFIALG